MATWIGLVVSSGASVALALLLTYVAFRVEVEGRLARVETALANHPPHAHETRLASVEAELRGMAPFREILTERGSARVRAMFAEDDP